MIRSAVLIKYTGKIITIIGIAMLSSFFWAVYYQEDAIWRMLLASAITIVFGLLMSSINRKKDYELNYREGFAIVSLGWIIASFFGTLPFLLGGHYFSFADAFFETVSGFTTTGATVITDIEALPKSLLFWRSLTQWLGGMGIMALFLAVISGIGSRANQIFRAEIPGPVSDKISPRIKETARILWLTYVVLSSILLISLYALGMDFFDSLCHTFSTMATGGYSTKNSSIAGYSPLIQWTIILFMFIGGVNFSLHYLAFKRRSLKAYFKNWEFIFYSLIITGCAFLALIGLTDISGFEEKIRTSLFHIVSILTTTGYVTTDYTKWAPIGQGVILAVMLIGGCAGSTAGGIKVGRYLIMLGRVKIELKKMIHPKALIPVRFGDRILSDELVINVLQFFFIYIALIIAGTVLMSSLGLDLFTSLGAVIASIGNIGPGFGSVGPAGNYNFIPDIGKYMLSILMLLGRLEIYPLLLLLFIDYWRK